MPVFPTVAFELPCAPGVDGKNVIRHGVHELRVWPFDPDLNSLARHDRGCEPSQRNALGVLLVAPDQLGPGDAKLVERKDDALRAVLFSRVKVDDVLGGGAVLEVPDVLRKEDRKKQL